jgi:hypothetical protein
MKKILGLFILLSVLFVSIPTITKASTLDDVMNQIAELNQKVLDLQSQLSAAVTSAVTPRSTARVCLPSTPAWIELTSPNGGDSFNTTSQVNVNWKTCNWDSSPVNISLSYNNVIAISCSLGSTANDGAQVVDLDQAFTCMKNGLNNPAVQSEWAIFWALAYGGPAPDLHIQSGNYYKIQVINGGSLSDSSDNYFTINAPIVIDNTTTEPKTTTNTTDTLRQAQGQYQWINCVLKCIVNGTVQPLNQCSNALIPTPPLSCQIQPTQSTANNSINTTTNTPNASDRAREVASENAKFNRVLDIGLRKDSEVMSYQNILKDLGFLSKNTVTDGSYGKVTKEAVKRFQRSKGISPTGKIGSMTRDALDNLKAPNYPNPNPSPNVSFVKTDPVIPGTFNGQSQTPSMFKGKGALTGLSNSWNVPIQSLNYWFRYGNTSQNLNDLTQPLNYFSPPALGWSSFSQTIGGFYPNTNVYVKACVGDATTTNQIMIGTGFHFACGNVVSFMLTNSNPQATSITATLDASSPSNQIVYDNQTITSSAFKFTALGAGFNVTNLTLAVPYSAATVIQSVTLYDGSTPISNGTLIGGNTSYNFSGLAWNVPTNTTKVLTVKFTLGNISAGSGTSGADIKTTLTSFTATNMVTGVSDASANDIGPSIENNPTGNDIYVYAAIPKIYNEYTSTVLSNGIKTLLKFSIEPNGGSISWDQLYFDVTKDANTILNGGVYLYNVTGGGNSLVSGVAVPTVSLATPGNITGTITFTPTGEQMISSQNTYELRASISGANSLGDFITAALANYNTSVVSPNTVTYLQNYGLSDSIIWSDISAINHYVNTTDWVTDFGVQNLPILHRLDWSI